MLILLSPAKTLDFETPFAEQPSEPRFARDAARIARAAARLGPAKLSALMHISPALAAVNHQRFKQFAKAEARPAIRAFAGDVYRGFDVASADDETLAFAQDHLRILSGLYGALRPLDAIRPYRLEMGTRWSPSEGRLVDYWGAKVAKAVAADFKAEGSKILLNLASNEYFAVLKGQLPKKAQVIAPDFRVSTVKGLMFQSFVAKVARGAMARWVCDERIEAAEALAGFDRDGWRFEAGGPPDRPLFVRR